MNEKIVFDPALGITPAQFVAAWNDNPAYVSQGAARVEATETAKSMDLASTGLAVVSNIAIGLLTSLIYDLVKGVLAERNEETQIQVQEVPQPDGTTLLVVLVEKG